jgi:hypothetical protein
MERLNFNSGNTLESRNAMGRDYIGNIRTFETANFRVSVDAEYDFDTDLSFDETGKTREQLESGELIAFQVAVTVTHKDSGMELGTDYLGGCIYKSIDAFQDHRECGRANRRWLRRDGRFQIYRKNRPYVNCLSRSDKLKKRGFATESRAEAWARANTKEEYQIMPAGKCGSYFKDMISNAIAEARKQRAKLQVTELRTA